MHLACVPPPQPPRTPVTPANALIWWRQVQQTSGGATPPLPRCYSITCNHVFTLFKKKLRGTKPFNDVVPRDHYLGYQHQHSLFGKSRINLNFKIHSGCFIMAVIMGYKVDFINFLLNAGMLFKCHIKVEMIIACLLHQTGRFNKLQTDKKDNTSRQRKVSNWRTNSMVARITQALW